MVEDERLYSDEEFALILRKASELARRTPSARPWLNRRPGPRVSARSGVAPRPREPIRASRGLGADRDVKGRGR